MCPRHLREEGYAEVPETKVQAVSRPGNMEGRQEWETGRWCLVAEEMGDMPIIAVCSHSSFPSHRLTVCSCSVWNT